MNDTATYLNKMVEWTLAVYANLWKCMDIPIKWLSVRGHGNEAIMCEKMQLLGINKQSQAVKPYNNIL